MGFEHSVKVPTQYKKAAKTLKKCMEEDVSVKNVIYTQVWILVAFLDITPSYPT